MSLLFAECYTGTDSYFYLLPFSPSLSVFLRSTVRLLQAIALTRPQRSSRKLLPIGSLSLSETVPLSVPSRCRKIAATMLASATIMEKSRPSWRTLLQPGEWSCYTQWDEISGGIISHDCWVGHNCIPAHIKHTISASLFGGQASIVMTALVASFTWPLVHMSLSCY